MWEISYKSIQRYFTLLQNTGYIPYNEVYDILSLILLEEFINESFQDLISEEDLLLLKKYLTTLFNKTCLIGCFPESINMEYWSNEGTSADVDTKINNLTTELSDVKAAVTTAQSNIGTLSNTTKSIQLTVASHTSSINTNKNNIAAANETIESLKGDSEYAYSNINDLKSRCDTIESNVNTAQSNIMSANTSISQLNTPRILSLSGITPFAITAESTTIVVINKALGSIPEYSSASRSFYITYNGKNYISWSGFTDIANAEAYYSEKNLYFTGTALYRKSGTSFIEIGEGGSSSDISERVSALENNVSSLAAVKVLKAK